MHNDPLFAGLDLGTSGVRACLTDSSDAIVAFASVRFKGDIRDPAQWWFAASSALRAALAKVDPLRVMALSVDGTSGTMLPVDAQANPLCPASMYNDPCPHSAILACISAHAPVESAAHGATSGLARALVFQSIPGVTRVMHQADWIASQFSGLTCSDENNALKTGYDPVTGRWPDWLDACGMNMDLLPAIHPPGNAIGQITRLAATTFGLSPRVRIVAGTTDGCASFLATGAGMAGEAVTALGTTLTLKLLSDRPIFSPEFGVYSHKILGKWLAGGASNTGGAALLAHFTAQDIATLSSGIDLRTPSPYSYYPLVRPGERFPVADPDLAPILSPRPALDADFLKGLLDGIARIEAQGYTRLVTLGAPPLVSVRSVGGGARNAAWTALRQMRLRVPMLDVASDEAALGAARLARIGAQA